MTQVIAAITPEYALLASDRLLTKLVNGALVTHHEDTCKLVSLCNVCGIGYSGFAEIDGQPTHEWIATELAKNQVVDPGVAARTLAASASRAFSSVPTVVSQSFLFSGWGLRDDAPGLHPHMRLVTNTIDAQGKQLPTPSREFTVRMKTLGGTDDLAGCVVGAPLTQTRGRVLWRYLKRLVAHHVSPDKAALALVREIQLTARSMRTPTVGTSVLGMSIPREAAERVLNGSGCLLLAQTPNRATASFWYFSPQRSGLRQAGPTIACGSNAYSEFETQDDPTTGCQSSSVKILYRR